MLLTRAMRKRLNDLPEEAGVYMRFVAGKRVWSSFKTWILRIVGFGFFLPALHLVSERMPQWQWLVMSASIALSFILLLSGQLLHIRYALYMEERRVGKFLEPTEAQRLAADGLQISKVCSVISSSLVLAAITLPLV